MAHLIQTNLTVSEATKLFPEAVKELDDKGEAHVCDRCGHFTLNPRSEHVASYVKDIVPGFVLQWNDGENGMTNVTLTYIDVPE